MGEFYYFHQLSSTWVRIGSCKEEQYMGEYGDPKKLIPELKPTPTILCFASATKVLKFSMLLQKKFKPIVSSHCLWATTNSLIT